MTLKIYSESTCFRFEVYMIFFFYYYYSSCINCVYSSEALQSADKISPSMKLMNVISGNTACNPLRLAGSVTLGGNKDNVNSSTVLMSPFVCHGVIL